MHTTFPPSGRERGNSICGLRVPPSVLLRPSSINPPSVFLSCDTFLSPPLPFPFNNSSFISFLFSQVETKDALLHAINEEYVEAVEMLLEHEESVHVPGEPHVR